MNYNNILGDHLLVVTLLHLVSQRLFEDHRPMTSILTLIFTWRPHWYCYLLGVLNISFLRQPHLMLSQPWFVRRLFRKLGEDSKWVHRTPHCRDLLYKLYLFAAFVFPLYIIFQLNNYSWISSNNKYGVPYKLSLKNFLSLCQSA